jgi:adenylate cyclase
MNVQSRRTAVAAPPVHVGAEARETRRNAAWLAGLRLVGVGIVLGLHFWLVFVLGRTEWADGLPVFGGWFAASLAAWWALRWQPKLATVAGYLVGAVDIPMVFWAQWLSLGASNPSGVAGFTVGIFAACLGVAALSLDRAALGVAVGAAVVFEAVLMRAAGLGPALPLFAAVVLGTTAAGLWRLVHRVRALVTAVAEEGLRRERLGRYFSPAVAERLMEVADSEKALTDRVVTVLFADLRGFTAASANLPPSEVVALLNEFHGRMVDSVFRYRGTLDKIMGDGLMAYFGAPLEDPDHARHGVLCALDMVAGLEALNRDRAARGLPALDVAIGLHTGPVIVADVGAVGRRQDFTAIGDTVNTASRLEGLSKERGRRITCSEQTRAAAGAGFTWKAEPDALVRGKAVPVRTWSPTDSSEKL